MHFKLGNHQNSHESLKGLSLYVCPCAQVSFPGFVHWHTCAPPDSALQEGAEKEGSWRSSQSNAFTLHQIPAVGLNPLCKACVYSGFPMRRRRPLKWVRQERGRAGRAGQRECIHRRSYVSIVPCPPVVPGTWQMIVDNDDILWFF